jgi:hypothetical protein
MRSNNVYVFEAVQLYGCAWTPGHSLLRERTGSVQLCSDKFDPLLGYCTDKAWFRFNAHAIAQSNR